MVDNSRVIENTWSMLRYLYDELKHKKFNDVDLAYINTIDDLYALIICKWTLSIAKEGLYKEYVEVIDDELSSPKGQINIQQSIVMQTRSRGTLICSYDELSEDIYINHILKGILHYLLLDNNINQQVQYEIKKVMQLFNAVSYVDINYIHWKDIKFNNNNIRYAHLIEIIKNFLYERKLVGSGVLDDNKRVYLLFKKQMAKWIKQTYASDDTVEIFTMPYNDDIDPQFEIKINKVQKFQVIKTDDDKALIISIRLQDELVLGDSTIGRKHINEMVKCLREFSSINRIKPSGCIIYVNVDKNKINLQPININNVNNFLVGEQIVDIHDQWKFVANKINDCYKYFIQSGKNRRGIRKQ